MTDTLDQEAADRDFENMLAEIRASKEREAREGPKPLPGGLQAVQDRIARRQARNARRCHGVSHRHSFIG